MRFEINYYIKSSDNMYKPEGQEMSVKKLCRRESITNLEDSGGIFLGASSIYHCFFFLDSPLVISHGDPVWL